MSRATVSTSRSRIATKSRIVARNRSEREGRAAESASVAMGSSSSSRRRAVNARFLAAAGADAEEGREFGIGEVPEVVQRDHRPLGFGQRLDRGPHVTLLVGIGDEHRGIARARVDHVDAVDRAPPRAASRARGASTRCGPGWRTSRGTRRGRRGRRACGTRGRTLPARRRARRPSRPNRPRPYRPRSPGSGQPVRTTPRAHRAARLRPPLAGSDSRRIVSMHLKGAARPAVGYRRDDAQ